MAILEGAGIFNSYHVGLQCCNQLGAWDLADFHDFKRGQNVLGSSSLSPTRPISLPNSDP